MYQISPKVIIQFSNISIIFIIRFHGCILLDIYLCNYDNWDRIYDPLAHEIMDAPTLWTGQET